VVYVGYMLELIRFWLNYKNILLNKIYNWLSFNQYYFTRPKQKCIWNLKLFSLCTHTHTPIKANCTSKMASICHTQHYKVQMPKRKINLKEYSFVNITLCCCRRSGRWSCSFCISFEENDTSFPPQLLLSAAHAHAHLSPLPTISTPLQPHACLCCCRALGTIVITISASVWNAFTENFYIPGAAKCKNVYGFLSFLGNSRGRSFLLQI